MPQQIMLWRSLRRDPPHRRPSSDEAATPRVGRRTTTRIAVGEEEREVTEMSFSLFLAIFFAIVIGIPVLIVAVGNLVRSFIFNFLVAGLLAALVSVCVGLMVPPMLNESRWMVAISFVYMLAYLEYARRFPRIDVAGTLAQWRESGRRRSQVRRSLKRKYVAELERV